MTTVDDLQARTIRLTGTDEAELLAYLAEPLGDAGDEGRGGVVFIHHLPGWDRASRETTRRFAADGYDAICVNLYSREGVDVDPSDAAAAVRARGGQPDEVVVADISVAIDTLRGLPSSNGRVAVMGFCSGGRQSVLVGCRLDVDAVIDCWGGGVITPPPSTSGLQMTSLVPMLAQLRAPVLGLFGNDDTFPTPADVDTLEQYVISAGTTAEFYRYDGAGHGFMVTDRPGYRPGPAVDAWERVEQFLARQLRTR